jgi:hypothetical protein
MKSLSRFLIATAKATAVVVTIVFIVIGLLHTYFEAIRQTPAVGWTLIPLTFISMVWAFFIAGSLLSRIISATSRAYHHGEAKRGQIYFSMLEIEQRIGERILYRPRGRPRQDAYSG